VNLQTKQQRLNILHTKSIAPALPCISALAMTWIATAAQEQITRPFLEFWQWFFLQHVE
jgi:hypothetical protein